MATWIEISADYRCNNACIGCFALQPDGPSMATEEAFETLRDGRRMGATKFWFGGGDPTVRRDMFKIVKAARLLGYGTVKLETNGMLLGYPEYARRAQAAGVTEVNFALKSADAETHDRLAQTPGCFALMLQAMDNLAALGVRMEGDILVYRDNAAELPEIVRFFAERGLERFNLWLLSTIDQRDEDLAEQVPRIGDVMPHIVAAADLGAVRPDDFLTSLHTPPCTIPAGYERIRFFAPELDLLVCNPGGHRFWLEESPIEGGVYFEGCTDCVARARCGGARATYVAIHGDGEFQPLG